MGNAVKAMATIEIFLAHKYLLAPPHSCCLYGVSAKPVTSSENNETRAGDIPIKVMVLHLLNFYFLGAFVSSK
jgi:hypothetical protein